jgi:hypothetical protein
MESSRKWWSARQRGSEAASQLGDLSLGEESPDLG